MSRSTTDATTSPEVRRAERFVIRAGQALHSFGSPSHHLEAAMAKLARSLGLDGQFFSTPTAIFASFGRGDEPHTHLVRVEPGDTDLEKLSQLDRLLDATTAGQLTVEGAGAELERLVTAPPRYGSLVSILSFPVLSATAARFFGGGWNEITAAAAVGLVIGLLAANAGRRPGFDRLLYPVAGMLAAFLAAAWSLLAPTSLYVVTLAGLIVLLPGLTLTIAMTELAARHLVSGSARLAGALLVFLTLGFGVGLGRHLGGLLTGPLPTVFPTILPSWTEWLALGLAALAFAVQFRAHPRDLGWLLLACIVALYGGRFGAALLGSELGAFVGALLVGVVSHVLARGWNRPASLIQLPGLVLLVPGSVGFRSLDSLLARDTVSGVQAAFTMTLIAIALVTGLLVANVVLPSRRTI